MQVVGVGGQFHVLPADAARFVVHLEVVVLWDLLDEDDEVALTRGPATPADVAAALVGLT
ncbi:MAG: hypothetical protein Kow0069_33890 [Promethearchaeota archaeon]